MKKFIINVCADGHGDALCFDTAKEARVWLASWALGLEEIDFTEHEFVIELGYQAVTVERGNPQE